MRVLCLKCHWIDLSYAQLRIRAERSLDWLLSGILLVVSTESSTVMLQCFLPTFSIDMECCRKRGWVLELNGAASIALWSILEDELIVEIDLTTLWKAPAPDLEPDLDWQLGERSESSEGFGGLIEMVVDGRGDHFRRWWELHRSTW